MKTLLRLLCVTLPLMTTSCGGTSTQPDGQTNNQKRVIAISVMTMTNPFFKVIADEVTAEAKKHGYETIVASGEDDVSKQEAQVQNFIAQRVSAIILCPCDSRAIGPVIQEANKAGIPVFTADLATTAEGAKVVCHVATDNYLGGKQAGQAMIEMLGDEGGKVLVLDKAEAESCILRVKGFTEVIDAHNKKTDKGKVQIVKTLPGKGDTDTSYKATLDVLSTNSDIRGIFAINDPSALGAYAALQQQEKADQVGIIGFDGQPDGKQAIKEGKIYADPVQFPDKIGQVTVQMIMKYLDGEEVPKEHLIEPSLYRKADAEKDPSLK